MPATTLVFKEKLIYRTPMGVDDRANAEEDRVGFIAVADLLSNDLGGAAKSLGYRPGRPAPGHDDGGVPGRREPVSGSFHRRDRL
jgi:hypothetical protein